MLVNNAKTEDDAKLIEQLGRLLDAAIKSYQPGAFPGSVEHFRVPDASIDRAKNCPSCDHGHALNSAVRYVCFPSGAPEATSRFLSTDVLWLLDADMVLLSNLQLSPSGPKEWHVLTTVRHAIEPATRSDAPYPWPNFCLFTKVAPRFLLELDFEPGFMDSGSRMVSVMKNDKLRVLDAPSSYYAPRALTHSDKVALCHNMPGDIAPPYCEFLQQSSSVVLPNSCAGHQVVLIPEGAASRPALIFHLGSAASNWRACPEEHITARTADLVAFLVASFAAMNKTALSNVFGSVVL